MAIQLKDIIKSTKLRKPWQWVAVEGVGRVTTELPDGDDSFPPAVKSYEAIDGWLFYKGHNGSHGVIVGSKDDLFKWMAAVDRENDRYPVITEIWDEAKHGGANHVKQAINMARKTARKFGISITLKIYVDSRPMAASNAGGDHIDLVNVHTGNNEDLLGMQVPWSAKVGAHEASHLGFSKRRDRGGAVLDVLKWRKKEGRHPISTYHAMGGDMEGTAEVGAAYMLIPKVLQAKEPELFAVAAWWFGDAPEPENIKTGGEMEDRIAQRRQAAMSRKISIMHQAGRRTLTDPLFNLRECAKQMLLLEDHLAHPYKICEDCVRKHLLTIEALAEEASSMDRGGENVTLSEALAEKARQWLEVLTDGKPPKEVADEIRHLRKGLVPLVYDPREAALRVASLHVQRGQCRHQF